MGDMRESKIVPPEDLEVFDRKKPPPSEEPWVTRGAAGYFVYNPAAYAALGRPAAVEYLFSPQHKILGFRAADPDSPLSYPVYQQGNSKNFQSAGQALHSHYGLPTGQAFRYRAELIEGILYIDLDDEDALPVGRKSPRAEE